ncbi:unnamed protein product [Parascedosporium putredinis]|uniref:protein disulfide-isomerase n=1 Tax=Parascedosporium putredinis TaxID=1442378 RepID=A0A9P1M5J5_9PEZI|nr:unnamed protein product [Parascedosporium putredinis]CAI7987325.1 unnamed protein product [Parascedosporium putredinis]
MHLRSLVLSGLVAAVAAKSAVLDLIPSNFDEVVHKSGKATLVEFFAPWCGHCKNLAPVYEELAFAFEHASDKVQIAKVDADAEKSLGKRYGVQGFPTLKWFDGKSDKPEEYQGGRDLESLSNFIAEKTGVKLRKKWTPPSAVEMLNDQTLNKAVGKDKHVLVAFTAPWCGRMFYSPSLPLLFPFAQVSLTLDPLVPDCKTLAPTWEALAISFAPESDVLIAKVDCDSEGSKAACAQEGVTGFPTIKFFPKGSTESAIYNGGRAEKDLAKYINKKAGTHRVEGGGLDDAAGTVEALDVIAARFVSEGAAKLADLVAEAKKQAGSLAEEAQAKSAAYYLRVLEKLGKSAEYVEKESARLAGMLKKGGLADTKRDELQTKLNILGRFKKGEKEAEAADPNVKDEL